jgi:hypothetical protein
MWNPNEHDDDTNLHWCWLRAVEWIRWPYFISQPLAPLMLLFWPWQTVVLTVLVSNVLWYFLVRPAMVILPLAQFGVYFVRLKWLVCPAMGIYFFSIRQTANGLIALFWPLLMIVVPSIPVINLLALLVLPIGSIGPVQKRFMTALGYMPREENVF